MTDVLLRIYLTSIISIFLGYILAEILNETKLIEIIGSKTSKIAKFGIHPSLTPVPALYLVGPRIAHATASALLREGLIEPTDLYIAILASNLPLRVMYIYRYYLPVVLPLLGVITLYYLGLRILFDLVLIFFVLMIGRRRYRYIHDGNQGKNEVELEFSRKTIKNGVKKGIKSSFSFALRFTPLFLFVVTMLSSGVSGKITAIISAPLGNLCLDSLGLTYITTAIFSPVAAYGVAKIMLGYYPIKKLLGCMFLGSGLFVIFNECWTRILPFYSSLYPKDVSLKLLFLQSGLASLYNIILGCILITY